MRLTKASISKALDTVETGTNHKVEAGANLKVGERPCKCKLEEGRKLVVCIDGTSNKFGEKNSNVVAFYSQIDKSQGSQQLTYYNSGIGTYVEPSVTRLYPFIKQWLDNTIDLAIAWNFKDIILAAYRWLSDTYQSGDSIYLFGFSRGAYQVRALAAMIETVGLIFAGNQEQIPFAYQLYADQRKSWLGRWFDSLHLRLFNTDLAKKREKLAEIFKDTFSRPNVRVHFVGVWDTVSSVGLFRGNLLQLTNTCEHICYFRHALALDERRVKFLPEYVKIAAPTDTEPAGGSDETTSIKPPRAEELAGPSNKSKGVTTRPGAPSAPSTKTQSTEMPFGEPSGPSNERKGTKALPGKPAEINRNSELPTVPRVKEVWFPGSHSDIGGGNRANPDLGLRRPSLLWIRHEAMLAGLLLRELKTGGSDRPTETATTRTKAKAAESNWREDAMQAIETTNSLSPCYLWWWALELLPFLNWKSHMGSTRYSWRPHSGRGRVILSHQRIHISIHKTKPDYKPSATFENNKSDIWMDLLRVEDKERPFYPWLESLTSDLKDLLETSFYDETTITPLFSQLEHRTDNELLGSLLYIATYHSRAILDVPDVIPKLCLYEGNEGSKGRDKLLSMLAQLPEDTSDDKRVSYQQALSKAQLDANTTGKQVLGVHLGMLKQDKYLLCGAKGLSGLAHHEKLWPMIFEENPTEALMIGLGNDDLETRNACDTALRELARSQNDPKMLNGEIMLSILALLQSKEPAKSYGSANGLRALCAQNDLRSIIIEAGPIPSLVNGLSGDSNLVRDECGRALDELSNYEDGQKAILDADVIPPIIDLLKSDKSRDILGGARGVFALMDHDLLRAVILEAAPIPSLVAGLSCDVESVPEECGNTLWKLVKHEDGRKAILDARVIPSIIDLLKSDESRKILGGAYGLFYLADPDDLRAVIIEAQPMLALVAHLSWDTESVRDACGNALRDIAVHEDGRKAIQDSDVIPSIMDLLKSDEFRRILGGARGLFYLADPDDIRAAILEARPLPYLVAGLSRDSESVREACGNALWNIAKHEDGRKAILEADVIPSIMDLLKSDKSREILGGARGVFALVDHDDLRTVIFETRPMPSLVASLSYHTESVRDAARGTLGDLASHEDGRKEVQNADVISSIMNLLKSDESRKVLGGANGLCALFVQNELRAMILAAGPMQYLVSGLSRDTEAVQDQCGRALGDLSNYEDGEKAILDANVIPSIVKLLESDESPNILSGAKGLLRISDSARLRAVALKTDLMPSLVTGLSLDIESVREACGNVLYALATHEDGRRAIIDADVVPSIMNMLKSEESPKICGGARGLFYLIDPDDLRAMILEARQIPCLVTGLSYDSNSVREACGNALYKLAKQVDGRKAILDARTIPALMELLRSEESRNILGGARGLFYLADPDDIRAAILEARPMPYLVAGLSRDSESLREACGNALCSLATHEDGRKAILDARVIPSIIDLLKSDESRKILGGAYGLFYLADPDDLRAVILEVQPIPSIVARLSWDTESVRNACGNALRDIASHENGRKAILDACAIPSIMDLLKSEESRKILGGARGLFYLADPDDIRARILDAQPLRCLVAGLSRDSDSVRGACGDTLWNLAKHEDGEKAILDACVIPSIIDLLKKDESREVLGGARGLSALIDYGNLRAVILEAQPVPCLVARLSWDTESVQDACGNALRDIAGHENGRRAIQDADVIPSIMDLLKSDEFPRILGGARGLFYLADPDDIRAAILEARPLPYLVAGLSRDNESVREACGNALWNIAKHEDGRKAILETDVIPSIMDLLKSNESRRVLGGVRGLFALVGPDDLRAIILNSRPMPYLVSRLSSDAESVRDACGNALRDIASYEDGRKAIREDAIPSIKDLLKSNESREILGGARGLFYLEESDNIRAMILDALPVSPLVAALSHDSESVREACGNALWSLAKHEDGRKAILDANIVASIINMLKSEESRKICGGAVALRQLVEPDRFLETLEVSGHPHSVQSIIRAMILGASPIPSLLAGLSYNFKSVREDCGNAMYCLAKHKDGRKAIFDAQVIPSIMALLKSEEPGKVLGGATGLFYLADPDDLRAMILQSDPVPFLTAGLACDTEAVYTVCGSALRDLAQHDDGRKAIQDARVVPRLMDLLQSEETANIVHGANGLRALATQDDIRAMILNASPLPSLVAGLGYDSELAQTACGRAFGKLAGHADSRQAILNAQCIPSAMGLLTSKDSGHIFGGATGLGYLTGHKMLRAVIMEAKPMGLLLDGLSCGSDSAQTACGFFLHDLALHDDSWGLILNSDVVPALARMLESEDIHKKTAGARGLYILAGSDIISAEIRKTDVIHRLADLTKGESEAVTYADLAVKRLTYKEERSSATWNLSSFLRRWFSSFM